MDTLQFTFSPDYDFIDPIDYFCEVCDDTGQLVVYVDEYDEDVLKLSDEDLCEFFGLDSDTLVHVVRPD